jgi:hypothetical protein
MFIEQSFALQNISDKYQGFSQAINTNLLNELAALAHSFEQDAKHAQNESRLLRIGIIGQIKRGKSSFLNSLLFNGKEVLPKAATPMTAALTKISYAAEPKALVEFYSVNEWKKVLSTADRGMTKNADGQQTKVASSEEEKAATELLNMVLESQLNVYDYLGKTISLADVNSSEELVNKLNDYVGAKGRFTPIVKSTELQLNIESLKDVEIVDTPGMNDPIASRSSRTKEFIGQCDVIFLLSHCGQFLDQSDMSLLAQNIPNKGIEDIVLIGSVFDGALMDEYEKYTSIQKAIPALTTKLNQSAQDNVNRVCADFANSNIDDDSQKHLMRTLQNALPPIFISSRCFDLSIKLETDYNEGERHTLTLLNSMFGDFSFDSSSLLAVANFSKVNDKLTVVRDKKNQILAERYQKLLAGSKREINHKLTQIAEDVSVKRKNLLDGDLDTLTKKQQAIVKRIESGTNKVTSVFEQHSIKAEKIFATVLNEIQQEAIKVKQVQSQTGAREERHSVCTGSERYGFLWLKSRNTYETRTRTINYTYANVQESVSKLEAFVVETGTRLFDVSSQAINRDIFKKDIKASVKGMFDFTDDNFDSDMVLMPLANAVERITIPVINLDLDKHINTIRQQFNNNQVEDDEITELRNEQARIVSLLLHDIAAELSSCTKTILSKLSKEQANFIPSLTKDLLANVEQLKQDLAQKEQALATYDQVLAMVNEDLSGC